jgi:putative tricarboxylic transport membrane protein
MDLLNNVLLGASVALTLTNIVYCFIGTLLGTLIGVLPGIGPLATVALLLPMTTGLDPATSLIMLAGIYYGAQYGGSTTAILINLPGEPSSVVTSLDGNQMALNGRAGAALAAAALSSFFAGTVATFVVLLAAPPLTAVALSFGPPEYFSLIVLGLAASIALASGSVLKALIAIVLGMMVGSVGLDIYSGIPRFTFGMPEFSEGVSFIGVSLGLFGIAEILKNLEPKEASKVSIQAIGRLFPTREELIEMIGPAIRGTMLGSALGILPGGGAILSSFASYALEKKVSNKPDEFGKGAIAGVAGPEAANNAGAQTSFIPMLTLGIPSTPMMALMIGAMIIQGITPGPDVVKTHPGLFWGLIVSMWIGNLMLVVLNLPLVGIWVKLLRLPYRVLVPLILVFSSIGVYGSGYNTVDVFVVAVFGFIGYCLMKLRFEPAPLLLGFILGPMLEEHARRAMLASQGSLTTFVTSPISATFLAITAVLVLVMVLPRVKDAREEIFEEQ